MYSELTWKIIGQRISRLRKTKGLSQKDLAKNMNLSRSSLAQMELGNRNISILELQQLSMILGFSIDDFLSEDFPEVKESPAAYMPPAKTVKSEEEMERIAVPKLNIAKFKNVLLYMLEKCAGKPNVGETMLSKLLYFSDFNYYELYEEHLTGAQYRKLPYGPVPERLNTVLNQMVERGKLLRIKTNYHRYPQVRFLPLEKADLTALQASEKEMIDKVIEQMSDWSEDAISRYAHRDMPWLASKEKEEISYELVFYREPPFSVRNYDKDEIEAE